MRKNILMASAAAICLISMMIPVTGQSKQRVDEQSILQKYSHLNADLNKGHHDMSFVGFLHEFIDQDAQFKMSMVDEQGKEIDDIQIDKAGFINSFISARAHVTDYVADISDVQVRGGEDETLVVSHQLVEEGTTVSYDNKTLPQNYQTITTCTFEHDTSTPALTVKQGQCSTRIDYQQDI